MRVTLVVGYPRAGKTRLALAVARGEAARVLVLDPVKAATLATVPPVESWRGLARWLAGPDGAGERWEVALRSPEPSDYVAALRYAEHYRHVTLLVDEALVFTANREALPWLVKAARTSAHFGGGAGVNLILTAQRPYDLPPDVRATVTRLYMFRTREPGDLEYLTRFTLDPELAARVAGLEPHQYVEYPPTTTDKPLEVQTLGGEEDSHDALVFHGGARRGGATGAVPDRPEAEPHPQAPRGDQVARATT